MTVDDMLANFEEVQLIHLTPDALSSEIANNEVFQIFVSKSVCNTFNYHYIRVITPWEFFLREVGNSTNLAWLPGQVRNI